MIAFIKSIADYKILLAAQVISYDVPISTFEDERGTIVVEGTKAAGCEGNWLILGQKVWLIKSVEIGDGRSEISVVPAINAFDRALFFSGEYTSTEKFIWNQLFYQFRQNDDEFVAMPYLNMVYNAEETEFIEPEVDDNQMYNLKTYLQQINSVAFAGAGTVMEAGVNCEFSDLSDLLSVQIKKITPKRQTAHFNNNRFELIDQAHDNTVIGKVSIILLDGSGTVNYYLENSGAVSDTSTPAKRVRGKWVYAKEVENETPLITAYKVFRGNEGSHKVEFFSTEKYSAHDTVEMLLEGRDEPDTFEISCVRISSDDERYRYTCGDMPVTLTDRVGKATTLAGSGKTSPADYVVARGTTGRWSWAKYASGLAECWGVFGDSMVNVNSAWGSVYYGGWMGTDVNKNGRKYPFEFKAAPAVTAQYIGGNGDAWLVADVGNNVNELTHAPAFSLVRPSAGTIYNPRIAYHAIGRWK